jgi:hypothetical protein
MVMAKGCRGLTRAGSRCQAPPGRDREFCFWHDPEHTEAAAEARRLGGLRRRREGTLQGAYELDGVDSVTGLRRYLEVALYELMGLENSVARSRAIFCGVLAAAKLLEVGEMEERLAAIESALGPRVIPSNTRRR